MDKVIVSLFLIVNLAGLCLGSAADCKYTSGGKTYDLTPLKKSYSWNQTVINTAQNLYTNPDFSETANFTFTVGVCENAQPSKECKGPGAVFMYDQTAKKCTVLGSMNASVIELNPFQDGVYVDYYNGDAIDHITRYEARIYFVCDSKTTLQGPVFEHMKDSYQVHFHVNTKHTC